MTPQQEEHLQRIKDKFSNVVDPKYRKGVWEHGGNLWENKHIIDFAIEEAVDQVVYLFTLKDQLNITKHEPESDLDKVKALFKKLGASVETYNEDVPHIANKTYLYVENHGVIFVIEFTLEGQFIRFQGRDIK